MRISERAVAAIVAANALLGLSACGASGGSGPAAYPAGPPSGAVAEMKVPDSPYYIIYHPPVSLAKRPTR
jgi:hypothetical protein